MNSHKVILHGLLIDGTGADPVADSAVLIRGKQIEAVGRADDVTVPDGAAVIDAAGKTVMPGLVEGHAHVGGEFESVQTLRLSLQRGITTICSVCANPPGGIRLRDAIARGALRGCARLVAGCVVCPTHGHVKGRTADGPWEVRKAVREVVMAGADFIKTAASGGFWAADENCSVRNYTYEELDALADEAHAWGVPVVVHAHTQPGLNNSIRAGIDQIHHGAFIDEEAVRGIKEKGLYYVPTLRVTCDRNIAAWPDRPWMAAEMKESQPIHRAGVRLAHELGVKIAGGTDFPGSKKSWLVGDATLWELIELTLCGITPAEAIVMYTRNTAEAYGRLDKYGTLEPGKMADLLVVGGNPLDDVAVLYDERNINLVVKEGVVEYADEAHKNLYRVGDDQPGDRSRP
ncbi:MAG: amidohydrolase family protein [Kiritimatiellae bacterium]|nr:amidohydrolase family protein [Kiritimatiellia bacterium]